MWNLAITSNYIFTKCPSCTEIHKILVVDIWRLDLVQMISKLQLYCTSQEGSTSIDCDLQTACLELLLPLSLLLPLPSSLLIGLISSHLLLVAGAIASVCWLISSVRTRTWSKVFSMARSRFSRLVVDKIPTCKIILKFQLSPKVFYLGNKLKLISSKLDDKPWYFYRENWVWIPIQSSWFGFSLVVSLHSALRIIRLQ